MHQHDLQTDILRIDQTIQQSFQVPEEARATDIELDEFELSSSFRKKLELEKEIEKNSVEAGALKHFYFLDTVELIQKYKQTLQTPIKINFLSNTKEESVGSTGKEQIVQEFFETVKEYKGVDLPYVRGDYTLPIIKDQKCIRCESSNFTESTDFSGIMICLDCGNQETTLNLANSIRLNHNDSKRVNICSKYSYDKKSHFLNCINQYQGKHKSGIEPEILGLIETELNRYNLIDHSKKMKKSKFRNVTKEHIFLFVKELKLTKCYGDINLIHHLITGQSLNDISHLTEKLLHDFDQFVQMHHKQFPNDVERKNFNYQHLLYQLLMRHKYPCNPTEFNFLKTIDRKYYHDEICRTIFENLGWNYSALF